MPMALNCSGNAHDGILWVEVTPQLSTIAAHNPQFAAGIYSNYSEGAYLCYASADAYMPTLIASAENDLALVYNYSATTITPASCTRAGRTPTLLARWARATPATWSRREFQRQRPLGRLLGLLARGQHVKPGLRGVLAQRLSLRPDRLVLLLPGTGDPGVDRRARHGAAVLPGQPARCGPAAAAPIWRRPPTIRWPRDGRRRTPPRPPGRSPAGMVSAAPGEKLLQRLCDHGGDRAPRQPGMLPDRAREPGRTSTVNTTVASGTGTRPPAAA